jgi:hypothetical protein
MRLHKALAAALTTVSLVLACTATARAEGDSVDTTFGRTVSHEVMSVQRGKAVTTLMDVDGSVQDNAAINNVTGRNVITNGAFSNASGLSTTIQNSGNNVLIQNATILQLDVR